LIIGDLVGVDCCTSMIYHLPPNTTLVFYYTQQLSINQGVSRNFQFKQPILKL
jgi:hypothetical protein